MAVNTCGKCGALVSQGTSHCPRCGRSFPTLFGLHPVLDRFFAPEIAFPKMFALLLIIFYLASLLLTREIGDVPQGFMGAISPGNLSLNIIGASLPSLILEGEWWRLVTGCLLHGGPFHIAFNLWALFQLGIYVSQFYGNARLTTILFVAGVVGNAASVPFNINSVGASGAVCGLIGAVIAFGARRGGAEGTAIRNVGVQWIIYIVLFGFLVPNINNTAHIAGAVAGFATAWFCDIYSLPQKGRESDGARLVAIACLLITALAVILAIFNTVEILKGS